MHPSWGLEVAKCHVLCFLFSLLKATQDVYLQECLNTVGIWKADLKYLLAEDMAFGWLVVESFFRWTN